MITVPNIEISGVTLTPSTVVTGAQYIIAAAIEPRLFGIADVNGDIITTAAGNPIVTHMDIIPQYVIGAGGDTAIITAEGRFIYAEGE